MSDPVPTPPSAAALTSDQLSRLSDRMGMLLLAGVVLAATFLLVGILGTLLEPGAPTLAPSSLTPSRLSFSSFTSGGIFGGLILVGFVLLIATPVARVVLSLGTFAEAREKDYVGVLLLVLGILFASVLVGAFL